MPALRPLRAQVGGHPGPVGLAGAVRDWWQRPRAATAYASPQRRTRARPQRPQGPLGVPWQPGAAVAVPRGWGLMVVHRSDRLDTTMNSVPVAVDDQPPGHVRYDQHRAVALPPGAHRLQAVRQRPLSEVLEVDVAAGRSVHVVLRLDSALRLMPQLAVPMPQSAISQEGLGWALVVVDGPPPPAQF